MDATIALFETALELLKTGAADNGLYGRMRRLAGHALFALGRIGSEVPVTPELNKELLKACDDFERDGLSQTHLRDKVIEFKYTNEKQFKAVFSGKSSLLLHKAAREFFRQVRSSKRERESIVCLSLGMACLLLAEERYGRGYNSLQECLEQKSVVKEVVRTSEDQINFLSLTGEFSEIFQRFTQSPQKSTSIFESYKSEAAAADQEI